MGASIREWPWRARGHCGSVDGYDKQIAPGLGPGAGCLGLVARELYQADFANDGGGSDGPAKLQMLGVFRGIAGDDPV